MTNEPSPAPFEVTISARGAVTVLSVRGEVDLTTAPRLSDAVDKALADLTHACLVVDLSEVAFLASAGMTVLIDAHARASQRGPFAVVASGPNTARPLELVGLDAVFALYTDLDSAVTAVSS